ncbi:two-component system, cell cycle response regulator CtrA [Faunimonas pinastri]|uniref:Two-component system, cell cycle response regulator CtrA n=1 Tax=Faunimonas pinastri TaxID=1855383 RepID=A0A1H9I8X2_9HYPH|nr:helix-turn-helix domain-containing protein [Faunimonas pinastri]SEQ71000.1 two-component system, cell cycle response regulator CtrA [Faunimonas pinastri]
MDVNARLDALQAEIDRLQDRIEILEAAMGMEFLAPVEFRLTGSENRVLGVLLKRDLATRNALLAALYRDDGRDQPEEKIIDVFICKLRAKLRPFGLEIATHWGNGWSMTPAMKARIHEIEGHA